MSTQLSHSDTAQGLSVCHVNSLSWLSLVRLVTPTHTVISCKGAKSTVTCPVGLQGRRGQFKQAAECTDA